MELQKKIAVTSVNKDAYSETFIKAQIERLPASLVMHSGWLPQFYANDQSFDFTGYKNKMNQWTRFLFGRPFFYKSDNYIAVLKKYKIEVVLAQYGPAGVAMMSICQRAGVDLVVHFHGYDASVDGILKQLEREPYPLPQLEINTEFWQTETGECGVGLLNTNLKGFQFDDFILKNYESHPSISIPLSN